MRVAPSQDLPIVLYLALSTWSLPVMGLGGVMTPE
jgi:hypothetical protein